MNLMNLSSEIKSGQGTFGLELSDDALARLESYYALLLKHNPILHLIGPMDAKEFAVRHILESLMLLKPLPENARFADVGSGCGLPAIPFLMVPEDLNAILK